MPDDAELLLLYARDRSEAAFSEFVRRHLGLVYRAAWRQSLGQSSEAEEIAQRVFLLVSHRAAELVRHPSLAGWLHTTVCHVAREARRRERRRMVRERTAAELMIPEQRKEADWTAIRPVIDQVLQELDRDEQDLLLLRFFEDQPFSVLGPKLGLTQDAARMRLNRALARLRTRLAARQIHSTEAALGAMLLGEMALGVPAGLAETVTQFALGAGGAKSAILLMSIKKVLSLGALALLVAGGALLTVRHFQAEQTRIEELTRANQRLRVENAWASTRKPGTESASAENLAANSGARDHTARQFRQAEQALNARHGEEASGAAPKLKMGVKPLRYVGADTPRHALESFTWACYQSNADALGKLVYLDEAGQAAGKALLAQFPADVQAEYPTPEAFVGMMLAYDAISHPGPDAEDFLDSLPEPTLISPMQFKTTNGMVFQMTAEGWKWWVPASGVNSMSNAVLSGRTDATARAP